MLQFEMEAKPDDTLYDTHKFKQTNGKKRAELSKCVLAFRNGSALAVACCGGLRCGVSSRIEQNLCLQLLPQKFREREREKFPTKLSWRKTFFFSLLKLVPNVCYPLLFEHSALRQCSILMAL